MTYRGFLLTAFVGGLDVGGDKARVTRRLAIGKLLGLPVLPPDSLFRALFPAVKHFLHTHRPLRNLHVIGSHYTYSLVPFGYALQHWFGAERNMYDRLVHFSFGFLLAYRVREAFVRIAKVRGLWGYYLPLDVTLTLSATYEIIEWVVAARVDPHSGLAFLGSQGDVWDAQKDMLLAGIGAFVAMLVVALIHLRYDRNFFQDLRQGFRLDRNDQPLGEIGLRNLIARRRQR